MRAPNPRTSIPTINSAEQGLGMANQENTSLWGGRFSEATDEFVQRFTASVSFDRRMAEQDKVRPIAGSWPQPHLKRGR